MATDAFGISRQSIHRHLSALVDEGFLEAIGKTRSRRYTLGVIRAHVARYPLEKLDESLVHRRDFSFVFEGLPSNLSEICHYGFTEILNNAIDHSEGDEVVVVVKRSEEGVGISISDNGEGVFKRIARLLELNDPRESLLELSKGKLTTDPANHTGQGIFFTSRSFDSFIIESGELAFDHDDNYKNDFLLHHEHESEGTQVAMWIAIDSEKDLGAVFDEYSGGPDEYRFEKTVIPLRLALYEGETLVSRSQAKRILNRVEKFRIVILDFEGVDTIGQGFADEVFRVFASQHEEIELIPVGATTRVQQMINRVHADRFE
jgi:anti-sigma regulatory factor (Ser/Thr protein kinase)